MARHPLRRASDRAEAAGRRVCLAVAILGVVLGPLMAWSTHRSDTAAAERYADDLLQAKAVTVEAALDRNFWPGNPTVPVDVKWSGPGGVSHRAETPVPAGTAAGSEVDIWTTREAEITDPPPTRAQLMIDAVLVAIKVMFGVGGATFVAFQVLRYGLNRLRYRSWDRAWENYCARHSLN